MQVEVTQPADLDTLRQRAQDALSRLRGIASDGDVAPAKQLVEALRNVREYEYMGQLAEAVSRQDPLDAKNRRLYAQYLIDTGKATVAIDLLRTLIERLSRQDPECVEATGLLGRAFKQIFFDAGDKTSAGARDALEQAVAAYRKPYEDDPNNTWHGVNLVALLYRARGLGLRTAPELHPAEVAKRLVTTLEATAPERRDEWFLPTLAESALGLGDWDATTRHMREYVADPNAKAFQLASTLRQMTQVWDLERADDRARNLVNILRARLMQLPGGSLTLSPDAVRALQAQRSPDRSQLEAVLGERGPETFRWWKAGLERARSVAVIRQRLGERIGTGFLVRAGTLNLEPPDELVVLTNFHVVNPDGVSPGIRPDSAEVVFEAVDANVVYDVASIRWCSPPDRCDAAVLGLVKPVAGIEPLPLTARLPDLSKNERAYIIGYPGGRELAVSLQDNELLDHEGPPAGKPQIAGVCRVHYRTPTEGGSSGSPVFNATQWEVMALHHKGGKLGMPRLNGQSGTYAANEGIAVESVISAPKGGSA
jgi:tetratricopeptide (TPR) repeat protein